MSTAAEFVGGPFDGEMRAVWVFCVGKTIPLPPNLRSHPDRPEWAVYRMRGDCFHWLGNAFTIGKAVQLSEEAAR